MANNVVLVHGYSSSAGAFDVWKAALNQRGFETSTLHACTYRSLTNEITIKDIAEGFDRALRVEAGLSNDEPFDAVVHSTGMLVVRAWLTAPFRQEERVRRRRRLKRLVGLAPATNGSPLAHKGRSWLGAMFKGSKDITSPDFLEAGDLVLDGLELGSKFTWELAHADLFDPEERYFDAGPDTPYTFIFCGDSGYGGVAGAVHDAGSDGTVRLASCALDSQKLLLDLTRETANEKPRKRLNGPAVDSPVYIVPGKNHGSIMGSPSRALVDLVANALDTVESKETLAEWTAVAKAQFPNDGDEDGQAWQQFVVRCVDERDDPITDYNIQLLYNKTGGLFRGEKDFDVSVHTYRADPSLRCFHLNLSKLKKVDDLRLHVMASSGTELVTYHGHGSERVTKSLTATTRRGVWDAKIDLSDYVGGDGDEFEFFYPFTTTFVEIRLNREPVPLSVAEKNFVCWFGEPPPR